ncbi:MAG: RagB/SusD family nutrient uptake outer membrane protein, partial [Tannerella sp.]|nr:RagB/SusD family nutrient uptake outer membrane protein [Tannerella sp.]
MKSTYKNILIIFALFLTASCNSYLDLVPDNIATMDMAFTTRVNAEKFLATCYGYVPEHASVYQNPGLSAGEEVWNSAARTYYYTNITSFAIAQGLQNTNDPLLNYWSGGQDGKNLFIAIRDCNIFLDNIEKTRDMTYAERTRWIAEVKTLKAFYHYFLMQLYGPIPIIRENIDVSAGPDAVKVVREPVDEVVKYIVGLLDEAIGGEYVEGIGLPMNIRAETTELGRLTRPAALALKAKVLVLAASPLFNGNSDFPNYNNAEGIPLINSNPDPQKWIAARDACKAAIDEAHEGGHELHEFNDPIMITISDTTKLELTLRTTVTARYNKELIWGLGNNSSEALQKIVHTALTAYHKGGDLDWITSMHSPTLDVAEQFYSNKGVPINEDNTYDYAHRYDVDVVPAEHNYYIGANVRTAKLHYYREPRFYASLGFDGGKWFNMEVSSDKDSYVLRGKAGELAGRSQMNYSITGYFSKKLVNYQLIRTSSTQNGSSCTYPFPIIRLSDLYLLYAEALNECKDSPDAEVYEYIQKVRDKAGLDKETGGLVQTWRRYSINADKPKSKTGMREIIRQERLIELSFEGQRF